MSRSHVSIAVVLPVLAIVLGIVRAELTFARTRDFTFEITGYDPRDLLRGHYLQFRLQLDPAAEREYCSPASNSCCLCLTQLDGSPMPRIERATCNTARSCDAWLDAETATRPLRFYVSDVAAPALERKLQNAMLRRAAHAVMALDSKGRAHVRQLLVDGDPIAGKGAPAP
jgi:hypothetical protein